MRSYGALLLLLRTTRTIVVAYNECGDDGILKMFREIRRRHEEMAAQRAEKVCEEEGPVTFGKRSNWAMNVKVAMENLRTHPLKVFDVESLLAVKGIGPKIAHVVSSTLFALYPPECDPSPRHVAAAKTVKEKAKKVKTVDTGSDAVGHAKKEYIPKLGTANYAFLIVLYREQHGRNRREYMTKEELMHAAEASCLANKPILSEGSVSQAQPGSRYCRSFYNGWSSFKSLVNNDLTSAWGNPKKISLTSKGLNIAEKLYKDAVARGKIQNDPFLDDATCAIRNESRVEEEQHNKKELDVGIPSLMERIEARLRKENVYVIHRKHVVSKKRHERKSLDMPCSTHAADHGTDRSISTPCDLMEAKKWKSCDVRIPQKSSLLARDLISSKHSVMHPSHATARMPLLSRDTRFSEEYDVVLLIDERERYFDTGASGHRLDLHLSKIREQGYKVEVRTLPIGDALWIARRKSHPKEEYVLDYIIERKSLEDLISSVKESGRYYSQKYRLQHCGLRNMYYLVEGEVEALSSSSDYKLVCTVCAKSSALDDFNVLRTRSVAETLRLYTRMTASITAFYDARSRVPEENQEVCLSMAVFESQCKQFDKNSIKLQDIWAIMLNEVPGLGPQASVSIAQAYPTPMSLRKALKRNWQETILAPIPLRKSTARNATVGPSKSKNVLDALFF